MLYTRRFINVTMTGGKRKVSSYDQASRFFDQADISILDEPQPNYLIQSYLLIVALISFVHWWSLGMLVLST